MNNNAPQQSIQVYSDKEDFIESFKEWKRYMDEIGLTFEDIDEEDKTALKMIRYNYENPGTPSEELTHAWEFNAPNAKKTLHDTFALSFVKDLEQMMSVKEMLLVSPYNKTVKWEEKDFVWNWVKEETQDVEKGIDLKFSKRVWLELIIMTIKFDKRLKNLKRTFEVQTKEQIILLTEEARRMKISELKIAKALKETNIWEQALKLQKLVDRQKNPQNYVDKKDEIKGE